ncbi:hypothetical protein Zm00014a_042177 [Zea mays]
MCLTI